HWLLPDGEADAVSVLQSEASYYDGEAEFYGIGPDGSNFRCGTAGAHELDCRVEVIAAAFVGIDHCVRTVADSEAAVIASAVAHVGMQNVVIDGVARAQHAVGKNMRMRIATLARNRVDCFHILGSEIVQDFTDQADGFVLAHSRLHSTVEFVV